MNFVEWSWKILVEQKVVMKGEKNKRYLQLYLQVTS